MKKPFGFTLIELMGVLCILALAGGALMVSFRGPIDRARFSAFVDRVIDWDQRARRATESSGTTGALVYDLDRGTVWASRVVAGANSWMTLDAPTQIKLVSILTVAGEKRRGRFELAIDKLGSTATYAVAFDGLGQRKWVVFSGGTGQYWTSQDDEIVRDWFAQLDAQRIDSH